MCNISAIWKFDFMNLIIKSSVCSTTNYCQLICLYFNMTYTLSHPLCKVDNFHSIKMDGSILPQTHRAFAMRAPYSHYLRFSRGTDCSFTECKFACLKSATRLWSVCYTGFIYCPPGGDWHKDTGAETQYSDCKHEAFWDGFFFQPNRRMENAN